MAGRVSSSSCLAFFLQHVVQISKLYRGGLEWHGSFDTPRRRSLAHKHIPPIDSIPHPSVSSSSSRA